MLEMSIFVVYKQFNIKGILVIMSWKYLGWIMNGSADSLLS